MTHVKRSTYQKVVEENKRLLKDITILVSPICSEHLLLKSSWQRRIKKNIDLDNIIQDACKSFIDHYPNDPAVKAYKEITKSANL